MNPRAIINLNNLKTNLDYLKTESFNNKLMAVVKANAYGHGVLPIARFLSEQKIHSLCVATETEIIELLDANIDSSILHLGKLTNINIKLFYNNNVRCTINEMEDAQTLLLHSNDNKIICHLKVDTGMKRMGCNFDEYKAILDVIFSNDKISLESIYTHLACSDEKNNKHNELQIKRFNEIIEYVSKNYKEKNISFHLLSSSGLLNLNKEANYYSRVGLSLYGVNPLKVNNPSLKPVMKLTAPVILIKEVKKNEGIGYGLTYKAATDIKIGIVRCGYADGLPTQFSNKGEVEFNGKYYPMLGCISMDLFCIQIDDNVKKYDYVTIWGGFGKMSLESISLKFNILPYVFLTQLSSRVERVYEII